MSILFKRIFTFILFVGFSHPIFAGEVQTDRALRSKYLIDSYALTIRNNTLIWDPNFHEKLIQTGTHQESLNQSASIGERVMASTLGIILEFTTNDSFNQLDIN